MYGRLAIASALFAAPAVLANDPHEPTGCSDVHIFIARGWNEDYPGRNQYLVDAICADLPNQRCDYEDVVYDAWSTDYCPNVIKGEAAGLAQINTYYAKCPNSKLVVSGYSEGATIMENILAGGGGVDSDCGELFLPLSTVSGASCNIAAAVTFGNPRHTANQSYNYLNGSAGEASDYRREASQLQILDYYQPRYRSYCNYDDLICAPGLGADLISAHTNYFDEYSAEAGAWIAALVKDFSFGQYCPISNNTSSTSSASASATPTASTSSIKSFSNATASATKSIAVVTVTDVTSVYTTVCPQTSKITTGGTVVTSVWTGPSTATTTSKSTVTATVSVTAVATLATSQPALLTTTVSGKSAVISCTISVSTTTYANFPTLSISRTVPVATSIVGGGNWVRANGTVTGAASGTGAVAWRTSTGTVPYTGAANGLKAAGSLAGVAGLVAMLF